MIAASEIVGVVGIELADGELRLRVLLSDGSVAACRWPAADLVQVMAIVQGPHAPLGAVIN